MRKTRVARLLLGVDATSALVAGLVGAALVVAIALPLSGALNVWIDEAFTLHTTGAGPGYAWQQALTFEAQPPFYFAFEAIWRMLAESSIAFARFPSTIFAAAAVAVIVAAAHRIAPKIPPIVVALLTALNPLVIWAATELRVYALILLLGAALTLTYYAGFLAARTSRSARMWYVCVAVVGLYTQYYIGFVIVAQALTLLLVRRAMVRPFAWAAAIMTAAFAPFLPTALMQVRASGGEFVVREPFFHIVHEIANTVFSYILPHEIQWSGGVKVIGFAVAAALAVWLVAFGRPVIAGRDRYAFLWQWLGSLGILAVVLGVTGTPPLLGRHIIVVAPSALIAGLLLVASLTRRRTGSAVGALILFGIFAAATFWVTYRPPMAKTGDWQRLASAVASEPSVPIAVFPAELAVPLQIYAHVPLVSIPAPMIFRADYVRASALTDESEVARVLEPVRAHADRLWLVSYGGCAANLSLYDYHCRYLEKYLDGRYHVIRSIPFRGVVLELYARTGALSLKAAANTSARRDANERTTSHDARS